MRVGPWPQWGQQAKSQSGPGCRACGSQQETQYTEPPGRIPAGAAPGRTPAVAPPALGRPGAFQKSAAGPAVAGRLLPTCGLILCTQPSGRQAHARRGQSALSPSSCAACPCSCSSRSPRAPAPGRPARLQSFLWVGREGFMSCRSLLHTSHCQRQAQWSPKHPKAKPHLYSTRCSQWPLTKSAAIPLRPCNAVPPPLQ